MTLIPEIWRARLLAATLLCSAGCYTEVPFNEVGEGEAGKPSLYPDASADVRPPSDGQTDPFDPEKSPSALDIEVVDSPEPTISEIPRIELDTPTTEDDELFAASLGDAVQPADDAISEVLDSPLERESTERQFTEELPLQIAPFETALPETDATTSSDPVVEEPPASEPFELAEKPFELADKPMRFGGDTPTEEIASDAMEPTLADEPTLAVEQPDVEPAATLAAASSPVRPPLFETPTEVVAPANVSDNDPLEVSAKNTRHVAWLLGVKLSFALLAPADAEQSQRALDDSRELADILKVSWQQPSAPASVSDTLAIGREIGGQLAENYSPDHAALVEIAFKTNILLALFDDHRELVHPIVGATAAACVRAGVPEARWQAWQQQVLEAETSMAARDAVFALHQAIEQMLAPPPATSDPLFR